MAVIQLPVRSDLGDQLIELGRRSTSVMFELVNRCADFDDSFEWAMSGYPTAAHWIAGNLDIEVCTAREWLRIGRALRDLPLVYDAFGNGEITYSKVRTVTRFADSENEAELVKIAITVPASELNRVIALWFKKNSTDKKFDDHQRKVRGLFISQQPDGSYRGTIQLSGLAGAKLLAALDARALQNDFKHNASADAPAPWPTLAQQRVDALVDLVTNGGLSVETELLIHVRGDGATLDDGTPITDSLVEKIAPRSFIRALIHDADSRPINASSAQRHPTARQKRVVSERCENRCVDCGSTDLLQFDHTPDFETTRRTIVDELFVRCASCHRSKHEHPGD